jgi:hypothetical protein
MAEANPFSEELKVFEAHRREWSQSHPGEFVAIQGGNIEGFFASYSDALRAGLKRFGVKRQFLVKQVWLREPVYCVS